MTARWRHTYPLQLSFEGLATLALLLLLPSHTLSLLLQPARVVALPWNTLATVELKNPTCNIIKEVTVVRYGNYCTLILLEVLLQPVDTLSVEVVGRLIKKQHIRLLQQQTAQGNTATLTTRQNANILIGIWTTQGIHSTLQYAIKLPAIYLVDLLV